MKYPKWGGTLPALYLFFLACFFIGIGVITVLTLGQVKYDDRDGPGWNPVSRLPDGKLGLSAFAIECVGFVVLCLLITAITGLTLRENVPQLPNGNYTIKSRSI